MKYTFTLFIALVCTLLSFAQSAPLSADAIMKEATTKAAREHKKVFVIFHASWCGWCHRMDSIMNNAACKKLFDQYFVVRHLVVMEAKDKKQLENPGAQAMMERYRGKDQGIPYWLIFDDKGVLVEDCMDEKNENTGCPATKEEVAYFVKVLKATTALNDDQLAVIETNFIKK